MSLIEPLLVIAVCLLTAMILLQIFILKRKTEVDFTSLERTLERTEKNIRDEHARLRDENAAIAKRAREELTLGLKTGSEGLNQQLATFTLTNEQRLEAVRAMLEQRLTAVQEETARQLDLTRSESQQASAKVREEVTLALQAFNEQVGTRINDLAAVQKTQLSAMHDQLAKLTESSETRLNAVRSTIDERLQLIQNSSLEKLDQMRSEQQAAGKLIREEQAASLKNFNDSVLKTMTGISEGQKTQMDAFTGQLGKLTESNEKKLESLRATVEERLTHIQEDNTKSLEQMRVTVDEKLQGTLDKRLGDSFKLVSERLELVHKGLGEMQTLATGVGDLKKVLTNVKTRGTWGEVQLGTLLEQVLTPEQYATNVSPKNDGSRVEFAVKLPGKSDKKDQIVWLPIDSKFPLEDYQRLVEAQEQADPVAAEAASRQLEISIKLSAKDIRDRYIQPPQTTDFAILFLPTEGLFAEVVRRPGLSDAIQRDFRVILAGPTTLWSLLNSLQMGFRTMMIQKRSSEVWALLSSVKTEWAKYGHVLDRVQKKLTEASNTINKAQVRTRVIAKKLDDVEGIPEQTEMLPFEKPAIEDDEADEE